MNSFKFELVFFILAISYITGHLFFRRVPTKVDEKSCLRKYRDLIGDNSAVEYYIEKKKAQPGEAGNNPQTEEEDKKANIVSRVIAELKRVVLFSEKRREKIVILNPKEAGKYRRTRRLKVNADYPYIHLYRYLKGRNLEHLAELVRWGRDGDRRFTGRTKAFINILKVRIEYFIPEKSGTIIRNEAHIRLMSSFWYICEFIKRMNLLFITVGVLLPLMKHVQDVTGKDVGEILGYLFKLNFYTVLLTVMVIITQNVIEKFFHYQRIREIIFVLETVYTASLEVPMIFKGLQIPLSCGETTIPLAYEEDKTTFLKIAEEAATTKENPSNPSDVNKHTKHYK
ncbi:MAG TPA: hypothetical protein VHR47_07225 [Bacillota bacterium]|nr:hypothetical protein [Bacillota bacterium]